jgi:dGTPase
MIDPASEKEFWEARRSGTALIRAKADYRDAFTRDRARVIHSAAFRRLQAKTQVLGIGEGDFHRTRLTHSMEAAQIARGIVRCLRDGRDASAEWMKWLADPNLIETIALCHDLGHPPFGHGGEVALNYVMREAGGFEGNGQTLRLLSRLEAHTDNYGLDLTRRTLLGILKYPVPFAAVARLERAVAPAKTIQLKRDDWKPPKCYMATESDVVEWLLAPFAVEERKTFVTLNPKPELRRHGKSRFHGFDTSIMELADDIAYGVHDFEDAIALRMITRSEWEDVTRDLDELWWNDSNFMSPTQTGDELFGGSGSARKRAIGGLVNALIVSVRVVEIAEFQHPLLRLQAILDAGPMAFLSRLQALVTRRVIKTPQVQTLEYRGQQLIVHLFEAFASDPERLLKESFRELYEAAGPLDARLRIICDFIAGMTDEYATRMYERLFLPRHGQFSDRL